MMGKKRSDGWEREPFDTLSGNTREILQKFTVDLPNKHGRGGQSVLRFARLRTEKCHNYVRKTAELARQFYINSATSQPSVSGLIIAGENGFNQAIKFSSEILANVKLVQETRLIGKYFQEIEQDTGKKYVSGVKDTLKALETGAVNCVGKSGYQPIRSEE
ncbi:hypothetical protein C5167_001379 [Papaver somniferum]|uniref:eRF1 domain-containing protein n=1 Tax=Papaver somniferum TaxID=3469 RepID=A0A4Y7KWE4_PAPSO|nr:hypothetical protein C5167_001379 [Papaver somniferum]